VGHSEAGLRQAQPERLESSRRCVEFPFALSLSKRDRFKLTHYPQRTAVAVAQPSSILLQMTARPRILVPGALRQTRGANMRRTTIIVAFFLAWASGGAAAQDDCEGQVFDSTYDLIQEAIFENRGCTSDICHGSTAAGGLDLRAGVSYDNLIEAPTETVPGSAIRGLRRVVPGQKDQSLLFLNLAAGTLPNLWTAPLRSMPLGLPPLTLGELEAVREWIEQGAPREGTVPGTGELLDACLPPPRPIEIEPLPLPPPGRGLQIRMPKWILPAQRETEVCFTSYYDVSDQVPADALSPDGTKFRYKDVQIRQDPLSHHLIVDHYRGTVAVDDPRWGAYRCRGGDKDGQACAPTDLDFCGANALCGSEPDKAIACIGFGPPDATTSADRVLLTQEASFGQAYPHGVFKEMPVRGLLIWNSHAFNLTDFDGKLEAWVNFEFAPEEEQIYPVGDIFNAASIFAMNVPAFAAQEVCSFNLFPPSTRLFELNSHTHKRGKLFRVYDGRFACDGGPRNGQACSPEGSGIDGVDSCAGAPCVSPVPPESGDCNGDGRLGINDLVASVGIALGNSPLQSCRPADSNGDGRVTIAELIRMVSIALRPPTFRDPEAARLYTNLVYNDPTVVRFDPPMELAGLSGSAAARTLTYCSIFDNGLFDPEEVKRQSTSPETPLGISIPGATGGPCATPTGCTAGRVGAVCSGSGEAARDASCDSSPGAGDGDCDACPLAGGVTTEDEMFILMGAYFVAE